MSIDRKAQLHSSAVELHAKDFMTWGLHSTEAAFLLLTQQSWVKFSALPKIYFDAAEIYPQHW